MMTDDQKIMSETREEREPYGKIYDTYKLLEVVLKENIEKLNDVDLSLVERQTQDKITELEEALSQIYKIKQERKEKRQHQGRI